MGACVCGGGTESAGALVGSWLPGTAGALLGAAVVGDTEVCAVVCVVVVGGSVIGSRVGSLRFSAAGATGAMGAGAFSIVVGSGRTRM